MRRTTIAHILALLLAVSAVSGAQLVNSVWANPYSHIFPVYSGEVAPRSDTQPPKISILSPEHNSTVNTDNISVSFKVEVGESKSAESTMVWNVYYKADWLENNTYVYEYVPATSNYPETKTDFSATMNLTEIPEGRHTIIVYATEKGTYYEPPFSEWPMWSLRFNVKSYSFQIIGASIVSFTVDVTPLTVTVSPIANQILSKSGTSDVPLNFTVNGSAPKISYALDGQDNVTITGNMTLAGMSVGLHNVIVYVWDATGNIGASENLSFTVAEPEFFSVVPVAAVFTAVVAVVTAVFLVYHKKHKRSLQNH